MLASAEAAAWVARAGSPAGLPTCRQERRPPAARARPLQSLLPPRWATSFDVPRHVAGGEVPDAGVLIHCFDSYEDHARPWRPSGRGDFSGSFIFAAQKAAASAGGGDGRLPLFNSCGNGGLVFAPGRFSCVKCGNGGDAGGHCHRRCPPPEPLAADAIADLSYPGDDCTGGSWAPTDAGAYLERVTRWQT